MVSVKDQMIFSVDNKTGPHRSPADVHVRALSDPAR